MVIFHKTTDGKHAVQPCSGGMCRNGALHRHLVSTFADMRSLFD